MFGKMCQLLEALSAELTHVSTFVVVNLRNMAQKSILESKALVAKCTGMMSLFLVN